MANPKVPERKMIEVCEIIATSHKGIQTICNEVGLSSRTFYDWLEADEANLQRYTRAREAQADLLVEEMIQLSDTRSGDLLETDIGQQGNAANVQRSKLQVETRKWIAAKLRPKKYGDKIEVDANIKVKELPDWITGKVE